MGTTEIQKIIVRDYCDQLNSNRSGSLEEMHKFLDTNTLLRLTHEKENLDKPITSNTIESVIKSIPLKSFEPVDFTITSCQRRININSF
jgi:hypothetical protein